MERKKFFRVVHVQVCFKLFLLVLLSFLPARVAANSLKRICVPGALYRKWGIKSVHLILTIIFKNILRTFEAEVLKIF